MEEVENQEDMVEDQVGMEVDVLVDGVCIIP